MDSPPLPPQNIVQLYSLKFLVVFTIVYSGIKLYTYVYKRNVV